MLAVVCPRQLEIRLSILKIPLSILPSMVEAIVVFLYPFVVYDRPQLVSASGHPELWSGGHVLARLGQPKECGCRFYTRFLSHL